MAGTAKPRAYVAGALALGVVAGMRSQMPLAVQAWKARRGQFAVGGGLPLSVLRSPKALVILSVLAASELVGDKLPFTPSRLEPGGLAARFVIGGLAGGAVALDARRSPAAGVLAGITGAGIGAFSGYHIRRGIVVGTGLPDPVVAVAEDALAIGIAAAAIQRPNEKEF